MKFSTRTTYGLRAMIHLGKNWHSGKVSINTIAKHEALSPGYLERIFAKLKMANLVLAEKGASGGYTLAQDPQKTTVLEIARALEGKLTLFHCLDEDGKVFCNNDCKCDATKVLVKVQNAVKDTLSSIKLADLL